MVFSHGQADDLEVGDGTRCIDFNLVHCCRGFVEVVSKHPPHKGIAGLGHEGPGTRAPSRKIATGLPSESATFKGSSPLANVKTEQLTTLLCCRQCMCRVFNVNHTGYHSSLNGFSQVIACDLNRNGKLEAAAQRRVGPIDQFDRRKNLNAVIKRDVRDFESINLTDQKTRTTPICFRLVEL